MKFAFFDAKSYDKPSFDKFCSENDIKIKYFETKLNEDTVDLAQGYDAVCVFVNDTVSAPVIDRLCEFGIKVVALRCAGFNNVDMKYAFGKIHVLRVPAYSPYAVAEHAIAMLLTSALAVFVVLLIRGGINPIFCLLISLVAATASTFVELCSKGGIDTITCPAVSMSIILPLTALFGG